MQRDTDDIFGITLTGQDETKSDNYCRIFNSPCCTKVLAIVSRKLKEIVRSHSRSWRVAQTPSRRRRSQLLQLIDVAASCANVISIILSGAARACRDSIGKRYTAVSSGDRSKPSSPQFTALGASAKITDHLPGQSSAVRRLDVGRCCHCCSRCLAALWRQLRRDDNHTHSQTFKAQSSTSARATAASASTPIVSNRSLYLSLSLSLFLWLRLSLSLSLSANYSPASLTCLLPFASFSY